MSFLVDGLERWWRRGGGDDEEVGVLLRALDAEVGGVVYIICYAKILN